MNKNIGPLLPLTFLIITYSVMYFSRLGGQTAYIIPSVLWVFTFILAFPYRRSGSANTFQFKVVVATLALFSIVVTLLIGSLTELGKSPYIHEPLPVVFNLFYGVTRALAYEFTRGTIVARFFREKSDIRMAINFLLISAFFTVITISPYRLLSLHDSIEIMKFINTNVFPIFVENILLTQIVYMANPETSLIYKLITVGFLYVSPILPNLPWTLKSTLSIAIVLVSLIVLGSLKVTKKFSSVRGEEIKPKKYLWVIPIVLMLLLVSGALGIKPYVIISGSMRPILDVGDIVFIGKTDFNEVHVSDIIAYYDGKQIIVHRVVDIEVDGQEIALKLKGDANEDADPISVTENLFLGKVVFKIPKIGLIPIYLVNLFKTLTSWS